VGSSQINQSTIKEIINHLLETETLLWDIDIGNLYKESDFVFYPFVNPSSYGILDSSFAQIK